MKHMKHVLSDIKTHISDLENMLKSLEDLGTFHYTRLVIEEEKRWCNRLLEILKEV